MSKLSYKVYFEDFNTREIVHYDIFSGDYWYNKAKDLKTAHPDFTEWRKAFQSELMSRYWCRSEYEIVLTSWPPYVERAELERLRSEDLPKYRANIDLSVEEKIDIYDQIMLNADIFFNYVWNNI